MPTFLREAIAADELPPEILERALSPATFERIFIGDDGETAEDGDNDFDAGRFLLGFFGSITLIFSIAMGGSALLKSVAEEKENRMIEVLLTSARPVSIMLGKVMAIGLAGLFQMAVWMTSFLLVVPRIFGAFPDASAFDFELRIVAILLFFFLGRLLPWRRDTGGHRRGYYRRERGQPVLDDSHPACRSPILGFGQFLLFPRRRAPDRAVAVPAHGGRGDVPANGAGRSSRSAPAAERREPGGVERSAAVAVGAGIPGRAADVRPAHECGPAMDGAAAGRLVTERRMSTLSEVGTVFVEEVARGSSRLSYRIIGLAVPVILIALLVVTPLARGIFLDDEDDPESQAVTGLGAVDLSGALTGDYAGSLGIQVYPDRRAGLDALTAGEIEALFVLPEDYISVGRVEWLHKGSEGIFDDRADEAIVRELLREALVSGRLSLEAERRFLDTPTIVSRTVQADGTVLESEDNGTEENAFQLVSYAFAMVMTVAILFGGGLLLESVSDEKENRMVEIILTSVSPLGLMAGKVLAQGALALAQVVLWVGSLAIIGPRIFDQLPEVSDLSIEAGQLVWLLLFFLAGYFVVAVIMAGLGAMTSSYTQSSQLSALVIVPAILPVAAPSVHPRKPGWGVCARSVLLTRHRAHDRCDEDGSDRHVHHGATCQPGGNRAQRHPASLRLCAHIPGGDTPVRTAHDPRRRAQSAEGGVGRVKQASISI